MISYILAWVVLMLMGLGTLYESYRSWRYGSGAVVYFILFVIVAFLFVWALNIVFMGPV